MAAVLVKRSIKALKETSLGVASAYHVKRTRLDYQLLSREPLLVDRNPVTGRNPAQEGNRNVLLLFLRCILKILWQLKLAAFRHEHP